MAHIHFGQKHTNGGIIVWFCGSDGTPFPPPVGVIVPPCGPISGEFEGSFTADDVLGVDGQGTSPGEFEVFVEALATGNTYVNVHSLLEPSGEIRGQIRRSRHKSPRLLGQQHNLQDSEESIQTFFNAIKNDDRGQSMGSILYY